MTTTLYISNQWPLSPVIPLVSPGGFNPPSAISTAYGLVTGGVTKFKDRLVTKRLPDFSTILYMYSIYIVNVTEVTCSIRELTREIFIFFFKTKNTCSLITRVLVSKKR